MLWVTHGAGLARWDGKQWSEFGPTQEAYNGFAIDPTDPKHMLVARHANDHHLDIYRSTDGGHNWQKINKVKSERLGWAPDWHFASSIFSLAFNPFNPKEVWFTDWYYAWRTSDITAQEVWENRYEGHEEIVTTGMLLSSPGPGLALYSGVGDVGGFEHTSLTEPPATHAWKNGLDVLTSTGIAIQETDPNFVVRVGGIGWDGQGRGGYSTDGGETWHNFLSVPGARGRVAVSATSRRIVWATQAGSIYVSEDLGKTWVQAEGLSSLIGGSNIFIYTQPMAADKVDGDKLYAYRSGQFYRSDDGGYTWQPTGAYGLPNADNTRYVTVATSPGRAGEVYVAIGVSPDRYGLWRSTDYGKTFVRCMPVYAARLFAIGAPGPSGNPTLYVYGNVDEVQGIFRSEDNGETWVRIDSAERTAGNEPNVMAADRKAFGRVFVGTNGNGIYYGEPA
ncbi:MAG TPA: sialidase family protein [Actinopolymorphaceae bacterium]